MAVDAAAPAEAELPAAKDTAQLQREPLLAPRIGHAPRDRRIKRYLARDPTDGELPEQPVAAAAFGPKREQPVEDLRMAVRVQELQRASARRAQARPLATSITSWGRTPSASSTSSAPAKSPKASADRRDRQVPHLELDPRVPGSAVQRPGGTAIRSGPAWARVLIDVLDAPRVSSARACAAPIVAPVTVGGHGGPMTISTGAAPPMRRLGGPVLHCISWRPHRAPRSGRR
jgi:hypothetical protein